MKLIGLLIIVLSSSYSHAGLQTADCILALEARTDKLAQEPLKSEKKLKMTSKDGLTSARHQFDLTGTDFRCEVAFAGLDTGTYINCWNKDMSIGVQADRTLLKGKGEHKVTNLLAISEKAKQTNIRFTCK